MARAHVLVIDDVQHIRDLIAQALEALDGGVSTTANGLEEFSCLERELPELHPSGGR